MNLATTYADDKNALGTNESDKEMDRKKEFHHTAMIL